MESSRASLMLQGMLPSGARTQEELDRSLLDGRFCEIRMLFYVGKDLLRWIEQSLELVERMPEIEGTPIIYQSFAAYLIHNTPPLVQSKRQKWGVADYKSIFARALGLSILFAQAPQRELLADEFVRNYYRYADQIFLMRQNEAVFADLTHLNFDFEIYASGEYSRMLEREWAET